MPAVLYNGMLAPVAPLAITGAIWYQGEQNSPRGYQYRKILPAMIADWRSTFRSGRFSVLHCRACPASCSQRDAGGRRMGGDARVAGDCGGSVPNSCLAVTIDTGDADNIHPKDEKPVGDRLAFCALAKHYGKKVVYSGPTLKSVDRRPGAIRLHFAHTDGGLVVKGPSWRSSRSPAKTASGIGRMRAFKGNTVVVSSPAVPKPKEVRYAWQSNPAATLFNGAGLPPVRSEPITGRA